MEAGGHPVGTVRARGRPLLEPRPSRGGGERGAPAPARRRRSGDRLRAKPDNRPRPLRSGDSERSARCLQPPPRGPAAVRRQPGRLPRPRAPLRNHPLPTRHGGGLACRAGRHPLGRAPVQPAGRPPRAGAGVGDLPQHVRPRADAPVVHRMRERMPSVPEGRGVDGVAEVWSRRKWLAMAVFALAAAGSITLALSLPSIYRSTATVIVEQSRSESGTGDLESRLQLISQEILSRSRLEGVIRTFNLYPELRERASVETVVSRMRRDIRTESKLQPQPSGLGSTIAFAISYRGRDPEQVAQVANALASSYLDEDRKLRERLASGAVRVLKAQLDEVKASLDEQDRARGADPGEFPQQTDATMANLQRLQADLRTASDDRMRALDRRNELLRDLDDAEAPPAPAVRAGPG